MNRSARSILVMLALALAAVEPVLAGGPSPDQRNEVLEICPQSDTNSSQTCNVVDGSLVCDTAATACGVTTPFAATLVVSVKDDPPCDNDQTLACGVDNPDSNCPGLTSTKGTTSVTLAGRRRKNRTLDKGGRPFTLSKTFPSCDFPTAVCDANPCDVNFTAFCCFAVRMTEKSLPQASELVYRPVPVLGDQLRSLFGVASGTPVIVSASELSRDDHSGATDALPSSVQFAVVIGFQ